MKSCKQNGIHTAIETNGTCPYTVDLFENIDLIISDFKHYDEEKLKKQVGKYEIIEKILPIMYEELGRFFFTPGCLTPSLFNDDTVFPILKNNGVDKNSKKIF